MDTPHVTRSAWRFLVEYAKRVVQVMLAIILFLPSILTHASTCYIVGIVDFTRFCLGLFVSLGIADGKKPKVLTSHALHHICA